MTKTYPISSSPLNDPLTPKQKEVYGSFLNDKTRVLSRGMSLVDSKTIDKYESEKDAKRKRVATYSIVGAVAFTLMGLILSPKFIPKNTAERVSKFVNNKFKRLIENATGDPKLKAKYEKYQKKVQNGVEYLNVLNNASTVKDAVLRQKIYNHIPPLRWLDRKSVDLYYKTSASMCSKSFGRMFKAFNASDVEIKTALEKIDQKRLSDTVRLGDVTRTVGELVEEVKDLLTKRKGILETSYGQKAQEAGRRKIFETIGDLDEPFWEKFMTMLKSGEKGEYRKLFNTFVAEDMIRADKARLAQEFSADASKITNKGGINAKIQEILEVILDKDVMQKDITHFAQKADKSLNRALDMHTNIFVDKMRDVCVSTAASDILGTIGGTGALAIYTAQAKNKEERKSVALTTGVPLALGMIGTTIATMKMVSGFKALGVGFATTLVSNAVGKSLDKAYKEKHGIKDKKPSIPTIQVPRADVIENTKINDYIDSVAEQIVN